MDKFLEYLKLMISQLKDSMSENDPTIEMMANFCYSPSNFYKIDKNKLYSFLDTDLTEEEKQTIEGLIYLSSKSDNEGNSLYSLDESQVLFLKIIGNRIKEKNNLSLESYKKYQFYKKIYSSLKTNHFTYFSDLSDIFDELNIGKIERIKVLQEIIENNRRYLEVTDDEVDYLIEYNNSYDILKQSLEKYGININIIQEYVKNRLLKHVNIDEMEKTFNKLNSLVPNYVKTLFNNNQRLFAKVAILCNQEKIDYIENFSMKYNIPIQKMLDIPAFLCPVLNGDRLFGTGQGGNNSYQDEQGGFEYLKGCVQLFEEKGISVEDAFNNCPTIFRYNPKIVRENIETFEFYGIKVSAESALSGIKHKSAQEVIDKYIEISENGYEYIKENNSKIQANMDRKFYSIYYAEKNKINIYGTRNGKLAIKHKALDNYIKNQGINSEEDIKERMGISKYYIDEEKQTYYDSIKIRPISKVDVSILENPGIKYLEENCKVNRFIYIINDTRISRLKVLRLLSTLKDNNIEIGDEEIKYALAYNSILTEEDIRNIESYNRTRVNSLRRGGNADA